MRGAAGAEGARRGGAFRSSARTLDEASGTLSPLVVPDAALPEATIPTWPTAQGRQCDAVVLGCTEIPLLIAPVLSDSSICHAPELGAGAASRHRGVRAADSNLQPPPLVFS